MSSSLLQEMLESTEEIEVIFQEYILTKNVANIFGVYCFFEGKDDYKYYGSRIKSVTEEETICYNCGGKNNVLLLYGMIKDNTTDYYNNQLLFFIDKDFDTAEFDCDGIYTTPCYAIENFYITDTAFCEFLKGELKISKFSQMEDKADFEKILEYFKVRRTKFIHNIIVLNLWYSLQKNKSNKLLDRNKPDLSQLKSAYNRNFKDVIDIDTLKMLTPNYIELSEIEMKSEENRLMENPVFNLRGKYYEEFLFKILNEIITDSNRPTTIFSKKRKVNLTIGKDNLISMLSQYADTPKCLKKYLQDRLVHNDMVSGLGTS